MKRIGLLGQTFGRLTVIEDNRPKCLCRCICGNEKLIAANKLANGRQKSCGCEHGNAIREHKRKNVLGYKYFRLTCVDNNIEGVLRVWQCDCGKIINADPKDVKSGNTKSCGCLKKESLSHLGAITCGRNTKAASQKRWSIEIDGRNIQLRSGFEYIYACHLIKQGIRFLYEPKTFVLTKEHRYTPDFFLPETNEWIEVKGLLTERATLKHEMFRAAGYDLKIVNEQNIKTLLRKDVSLWFFYSTYREGVTPLDFLA